MGKVKVWNLNNKSLIQLCESFNKMTTASSLERCDNLPHITFFLTGNSIKQRNFVFCGKFMTLNIFNQLRFSVWDLMLLIQATYCNEIIFDKMTLIHPIIAEAYIISFWQNDVILLELSESRYQFFFNKRMLFYLTIVEHNIISFWQNEANIFFYDVAAIL